jgi:hypothetical protein
LPLKFQAHFAVGIFTCFLAMLGIFYSNTWGARSLPFMSTKLLNADGTRYPVSEVFVGGVLNEEAFAIHGTPKLAGSFAYSMFMANAAVRHTFSQTCISRR